MLLAGNTVMQAICRTLMHSLWQGLIMAVLAGALMLFTKRLRPANRYAVFVCLLAGFLLSTAYTAVHEFTVIAQKAAIAKTIQQANIPAFNNTSIITEGAPLQALQPKQENAAQKMFAYFNAHANTVVLCWLLIIAFRCVQMLVGLKGVRILKRKGLASAGEYWEQRLRQLAACIGLKANITLWQSAIAKVPMVIGHFKPVILIPAGLLTALPQDEIEAILLHELAHIRRKDYLVNMLQNFCEILFFFNPAVLWVSSLIKDERENCCDDIALNQVKNKKQFIHALISFQEYNIAASKYAPGFPGKKDHLLNRVKRIITNNNKTLTNMEKALLATGVVLASFVTFAIAQTKKPAVANKQNNTASQQAKAGGEGGNNNTALLAQDGNANVLANDSAAAALYTPGEQAAPINDTVPDNDRNSSHFSLSTDHKGKHYRIITDNGKITGLWVDGEKIPDDKINDYKPVTDSLLEYMHQQQEQFKVQQQQFRIQQGQWREQQETFRKQQELFREQQERYREEWRGKADSLRSQQYSQQRELYRQQQERFREQQNQFRQQQQQMRDQYEKFRVQRDSLRSRYSMDDYDLEGPGQLFSPPFPPVPAPAVVADVQPLPALPPVAAIAPVPPVLADVQPLPPVPALRFDATAPLALADIQPVPPLQPVLRFDAMAPAAPELAGLINPINLNVTPMVAQANPTIVGIINTLADAGIITNTTDISFSLNAKELIVNGVTQPETLHKMLKDKYLKGYTDKGHIIYTSNAHSTISNMSINGN